MQQKFIQERVALSLNAVGGNTVWYRCVPQSSCLYNLRDRGSYQGNQKEPLINFRQFSGSP
ncbi:hypothetical protein GCM10019996_07870 [Lentilactobacillus parakefiri]